MSSKYFVPYPFLKLQASRDLLKIKLPLTLHLAILCFKLHHFHLLPPHSTLLPVNPSSFLTTFHKLTPSEVQSRKEKGLRFKCDEKYSPGHICKAQFHSLVQHIEHNHTDQSIILLDNALPSVPTIHEPTSEFDSTITAQILTIILNTYAADIIYTTSYIPSFTFNIQGHSFTTDFHILPVHDCVLIPANRWLRTLGPILTDHAIFTMSFAHNNTNITILGDQPQPFQH